jgi:hypothetical protein
MRRNSTYLRLPQGYPVGNGTKPNILIGSRKDQNIHSASSKSTTVIAIGGGECRLVLLDRENILSRASLRVLTLRFHFILDLD